MITDTTLSVFSIKNMNFKNIGTLVASTAVSSLLSLSPAAAVILVEPILTTADPSLPFPDFGIGVNPPGEILVWNAPDVSGQQNFLNEGTGLDITNIELFLFPDFDALSEDVIWGDVDGDGHIGVSDFFDNIEVDNNFILQDSGQFFRAPRVTFTGGAIPLGAAFVAQTPTLPDLTVSPDVGDNGPLVVGGRYDGVAVPEPSTILGLVSILGFGVLFNKKSSQKTSETPRKTAGGPGIDLI
ncbi:MAG: PEP-CTERM sorting domain-containing protein [Nostocaceae cyanobacterium]|nr:PEP-CTERM sorting domain-containing protein [Nostocaceae cyanobacterium]